MLARPRQPKSQISSAHPNHGRICLIIRAFRVITSLQEYFTTMRYENMAGATKALGRVAAGMRCARWLTPDRVRAYGTILLTLLCIGVGVCVLLNASKLEYDFRSFWAASKLALQNNPLGAYRPLEHYAAESTTPGFETGGWVAFFYPPIFLLVCLPLALLPFWWSAAAWVTATSGLLFASIRPAIPRVRSACLVSFAFPAAWLSAASGQSSILAAALFTLAARWLDRRPALAGVCFGCLAFKPQLGLVVPVALIAAGRWRTATAAALTVGTLVAMSVQQFGLPVWTAFVNNLAIARTAIELGDELAVNIPTLAGAALLLGASPAVASLLQLIFTAIVLVGLWVLARRKPDGAALGAAICVAAALCSPWLHFYDLVLLAFPIVWLAGRGLSSAWLPWEKFTAFASYSLPGAIFVAETTKIQVAPLVILALLIAVRRRILHDMLSSTGNFVRDVRVKTRTVV
jgi:alpha-1,2-mannosyltransferase